MLSTPLVGFVADQFAQRSGKPKITLVAVQVAAFKLPDRIWRMDGPLPRGGTSKIDKPGLRKMLLKNEEAA